MKLIQLTVTMKHCKIYKYIKNMFFKIHNTEFQKFQVSSITWLCMHVGYLFLIVPIKKIHNFLILTSCLFFYKSSKIVQLVHCGHLLYFFYKITVSYVYTNVMYCVVCKIECVSD